MLTYVQFCEYPVFIKKETVFMKNTYAIAITLWTILAIQSTQAATLTIHNESDTDIKVFVHWKNQPLNFVAILPKKSRKFNSKFHCIDYICWKEYTTNIGDGYVGFELYRLNKNLSKFRIKATLNIKKSGFYLYNFGLDGRGKGCISTFTIGMETVTDS